MQSTLRNKLGQAIYTLDEAICEVEVIGRNNRKHRIRVWTDLDDPTKVLHRHRHAGLDHAGRAAALRTEADMNVRHDLKVVIDDVLHANVTSCKDGDIVKLRESILKALVDAGTGGRASQDPPWA